MKKIGDIMTKHRRDNDLVLRKGKADIDEKTVLFIASRVISEQYGIRGSENIIPKSWKEKKLHLSFRSSLWMNEVWMERDFIRSKINEKIGSEEISDIKASEMW